MTLPFPYLTGSFLLAGGMVGITKSQTLRLSVVNVGPVDVNAAAAITQNPNLLHDEAFSLGPGKCKAFDQDGAALNPAVFDKKGRVQLRAIVRANSQDVLANVEVFDSQTGVTTVVLALERCTRPE